MRSRAFPRRSVLGGMAALGLSAPLLAACGDTRKSASGSNTGQDRAKALSKKHPESKDWPWKDAEQLNGQLNWPKSGVAEPKSKVTIVVAVTADPLAEVRNAQFDVFFQQRHPNIEIKREITPFADYLTKYMAQAAGGNLPDVMYTHYSWAQNFIDHKAWAPIDDYIKKAPGFDLADYTPAGLAYFKDRNGALYAQSTDLAPKVLLYNKTIFDKHGLAHPDDTWDFTKLQDTAAKLTSGKGADKIYGYTSMPKPYTDLGAVYLRPFGGDFLNTAETRCLIDEAAAKKALDPWVQLLLHDKAIPSLADMQALQNIDPFKTGRAAMTINGAWALPDLATQKDFEWGLTDVPKGPEGRSTPAVGSALAISAKSANKDAAWTYLNEYLSTSGYTFRRTAAPGRISAWKPAMSGLDIPAEVIDKVTSILGSYATSKGVTRMPGTIKAIDTAGPVWDQVTAGKKPMTQATKEIARAMNPVLAENAT